MLQTIKYCQQELTITSTTNYFNINDINYFKSQLSLINVYALTVHKIQSLTFSDIAISLDDTMFVRNHAYTALNKAQKFKQMKIIILCRETFKINKKAIKKYEKLRKKYDEIVQRKE